MRRQRLLTQGVLRETVESEALLSGVVQPFTQSMTPASVYPFFEMREQA